MKSKVAAKVKSSPKRVTRAASETARRAAFDRDLAAMKHPIDVYRDALRLEPADERAQREERELLEAATHAQCRARTVTDGMVSDSDTTLAALLSAGWLAHRRQRLGAADPALVALRGALDAYLATRGEGEIGQPLPALHGPKGGAARADAVRRLALVVRDAITFVAGVPVLKREAVAPVVSDTLTSKASALGLARGKWSDTANAALVLALLNGEPAHVAVASTLAVVGWTRSDANNAARAAV